MGSETLATTVLAPGNGGLRVERIFVTPEMAQEWLDRPPPRQRRIMPGHVRKLSDEMRAERWMADVVAPIQLASDGGWVLDGRHRLQSVVETKRGQWFYVAFECDPATFDVIDAIAPRTPANVLEAEGIKNSRGLEAVARFIHNWLRGNAEFKSQPPRHRVLDLARLYSEDLQPLFPIAAKASKQTKTRIPGGKTRNPLPPATAAFCAFIEGGRPDGLIGRLADWPEEETYNHVEDAVALFRTAIEKRAVRDVSKRAVLSLFVMAKNLEHTGAELPSKGLVYRSAAAFPMPEWPATLAWGADHGDDDDEED